MEALSAQSSIRSAAPHSSSPFALDGSVEFAQRLMELGASAVSCGGRLQVSNGFDTSLRPTLLSTAETVRRLEGARELAVSLGHPIQVIACTDARTAAALEDDGDARDRKFLSGGKTTGNTHAYCGGLNAAVSRAMTIAVHAEIVCYRSPSVDLAEAAQFASQVRASFPGKVLGFGYRAMPDGPRWNELDYRAFETRLRQIGYDFYFLTQFGQTVFPHPPAPGSWALIGDAVPGTSTGCDSSHVLIAHRTRFPFGDSHSAFRSAAGGRSPSKHSFLAGSSSGQETA